VQAFERDVELSSIRRTDFHSTLEAGFRHPKLNPITAEQHAPRRTNRSSRSSMAYTARQDGVWMRER
jgi:hypothetical protein